MMKKMLGLDNGTILYKIYALNEKFNRIYQVGPKKGILMNKYFDIIEYVRDFFVKRSIFILFFFSDFGYDDVSLFYYKGTQM